MDWPAGVNLEVCQRGIFWPVGIPLQLRSRVCRKENWILEEDRRDGRFFFAATTHSANPIFAKASSLMASGNRNNKQAVRSTFGSSFGLHRGQREKKGFEEEIWLAGGEAGRLESLRRGTTLGEYIILRELKLKEAERERKMAEKAGKKRRWFVKGFSGVYE